MKPGDTLTASVEATAVDAGRGTVALDTHVSNQDGVRVVTGDALVLIEPLA